MIDFAAPPGNIHHVCGAELMGEEVETAIKALTARANELRSERRMVGRRLLEAAVRDLELERDLNGCIAGVRALGGSLTFPANPALGNANAASAYNSFLQQRSAMASAYANLKGVYGITADEGADAETDTGDARANMPRIADIINDRLNNAGSSGAKSADIRAFILDTYDVDIHDKTVGMTLNRLQKEGLVRREGHIWFSASEEAKNPGDDAPGSDNTQS